MKQRPRVSTRFELRSACLGVAFLMIGGPVWAQEQPAEEPEGPDQEVESEGSGEEAPEKEQAGDEPAEEQSEADGEETTEGTDAETENDAAAEPSGKKPEDEEDYVHVEEAKPLPPPQHFKPEEGAEPGSDLSIAELGKKSKDFVDRVRIEQHQEEAAAAAAAAQKEEPKDADVDARAGYIPGYKRTPQLSLSPLTPRSASAIGGISIPPLAPAKDDEWEFKFQGYASAALRLSTNDRESPTGDQSGLTLHTDPRIVDFYGGFQGANATPGSWIDLHFQYGNKTVQSHVTVTTWKPTRAAAYTDVRSQQWIDQAYLVFDLPVSSSVAFNWTVGAFRNQYGGLGQYGAGQYNTVMIGQAEGVGENVYVEITPSTKYAIYLEHGFMGKFGKPPKDSGPSPFDNAQHPSEPSSWVHHAHVGLETRGAVPFLFGLHYLTNWSQDERDQLDNPATYFTDERFRPDGRINVVGADARMINNHLGNAAIAVAHADARDAELLEGLGFFGAVSGEQLVKRFIGQIGGGNGNMWVVGGEYNFSLGKYLHHPEPFWGEGPDLIASVFSNAAFIKSEDPNQDGQTMFKAGGELTYKFASWVGVSGRYDHVIPNSKDREETFDVISPKLLFKSNWITHEQVTLSYTRWFYGENTHAEFPYELPRDELDNQMFALHFGMWW